MAGLLLDSYKTKDNEASFLDFYDRIINLKFTLVSKSGKEYVFILRSDFEPYYPNSDLTKILNGNEVLGSKNGAVVRKCAFKPSIKVQYKNVSANTHIEIDVYVSNFYMFDSSGNRLQNINADEFELKKMEVAMGYFGQFQQLEHSSVSDLFNFTAGFNISTFECSIDYVTTESLPPDYTLHIHGFVGQALSGRVYTKPEKGSVYDDIVKDIVSFESTTDKTALEQLYFEKVTRYYVRTWDTKENKAGEQMSEETAKKIGVRIYCTDMVNELSTEALEAKMISADGSEVSFEEFTDIGETALNTLLAGISELLPAEIKYVPLITGDYLAYCATETDDLPSFLKEVNSLLAGLELNESEAIKLPAVYNITFQKSLCQITAPYYGLYNFGQTVDFKSRYILADLVNYYKGGASEVSKFFVFSQEVSFATNDNVNQCIMNLIGDKD